MSDSIFKTTGTNLRDVLASHDLGEILYTSIDVAKYNHSAMVVNFFGDVIIPLARKSAGQSIIPLPESVVWIIL